MSALRSDSRQPFRYTMMPPAPRAFVRSAPYSLPQQAPAADEDDELMPWLTVYADEHEPGTEDEMLMEQPDLLRQPVRAASA